MKKSVYVLDYKCGNVKSVSKAFLSKGYSVNKVSSNNVPLKSILVIPGVGHFGYAMEFIKKNDLDKLNFEKYDLIEKAYAEGIALRPVWKLLHKLKPYEKNPKSDLSIAEDQQARILSLPSSPQLFS